MIQDSPTMLFEADARIACLQIVDSIFFEWFLLIRRWCLDEMSNYLSGHWLIVDGYVHEIRGMDENREPNRKSTTKSTICVGSLMNYEHSLQSRM